MTELQTPRTDHAEFDALCEQIEDYQPLVWRQHPVPRPITGARDAPTGLDEAHTAATLDAHILAGLVSP